MGGSREGISEGAPSNVGIEFKKLRFLLHFLGESAFPRQIARCQQKRIRGNMLVSTGLHPGEGACRNAQT